MHGGFSCAASVPMAWQRTTAQPLNQSCEMVRLDSIHTLHVKVEGAGAAREASTRSLRAESFLGLVTKAMSATRRSRNPLHVRLLVVVLRCVADTSC